MEPGEQNTTAPFTQQCESGHNVGVARTAWYTIHGSGNRVVITTEGSSFDTALFAYSNSPAGPLATCNDDLSGGDRGHRLVDQRHPFGDAPRGDVGLAEQRHCIELEVPVAIPPGDRDRCRRELLAL